MLLLTSADIICEFCLFSVDQANRDYGPPPPVPPPPAVDAYSSYRGLASAVYMVYALCCMLHQFYSFLCCWFLLLFSHLVCTVFCVYHEVLLI